MFQAGLPLSLGTGVSEMVVMVHEVLRVNVVSQLAVGEWLTGLACIHASLVQCQRVE
jgi:hypothetical protein